MKFHKKLGVFEACKKVRKDFFDTLKKMPSRGTAFFVWDNIYFWSSAQLGVSVRMLVHSSQRAVSLLRTLPRSVAQV